MRFQLPTIPPLPLTWPYESRPSGEPPLQQNAVALPGLGKDWSLFTLPHLSFGEVLDLGNAFGRGGVQRWGDIVARPYRRGGLVRHVNQRIYSTPQRFAHEFLVHRALWLAGFPTVEPLGYGWKRRYWGFEGVLLTRFTESEPWPKHWQDRGEVVLSLKNQIQALCEWGLFAPDLNATNVMVDAQGEVLLLDWDRASWNGANLFPRYQARLLRSLEKLDAPREIVDAVRILTQA